MTFEERIVEALSQQGVSASAEFPGYIELPTRNGYAWAIGCNNRPTWGGELSYNGEVIAHLDLLIPADCTDSKLLADHVACLIPICKM